MLGLFHGRGWLEFSERPGTETMKSLFIFIDSMGWEILKDRPFLDDIIKTRVPLKTPLGYSSAAVPTILTGRVPSEHGHWSFFYYSPQTSPFKFLRWLSFLPEFITERGRVRNYLSKAVKKILGYKGYFQLYNTPLKHIHLFDYCEKKDLFQPGGFNQGQGIFDVLQENGVPYHVSNWRRPEQENLDTAMREVVRDDINFAFIYLAELDGLLHALGTKHPKIAEKIQWYEEKIRDLYEAAGGNDQVQLYVFSDHGQADIHTTIDLMSAIDKLGLVFGKDYVAFYDSTLARFWFLNVQAEQSIRLQLESTNGGKILSEAELKTLGAHWADGRFGELIFLVDPGVLIIPSHMGVKPLAAMHGYHPNDPSADSVLMSTESLNPSPKHIADIFQLMVKSLSLPTTKAADGQIQASVPMTTV